MVWTQLLIGCILLGTTLSGKVLVVLPIPMYGHTVPYLPIFWALAGKGHHVTFISPMKTEKQVLNFKHIHVNFSFEILAAEYGDDIDDDFIGYFQEYLGSWRSCPEIMKASLPNVKEVLPPRSEKFDVVIIEAFFCQQPLVALGHYYKAPVIVTHPGPMMPIVARHTGNPILSSYIPNIRSTFTEHMRTWERVSNTIKDVNELLKHEYSSLSNYDTIMRKWLGTQRVPYLWDMLDNVSLVLMDTHSSLSYPRPYTKNIIEVGGISASYTEPIPQDVEDFMNDSEGVIYVSFGPHIVGNETQQHLPRFLMETFNYVKKRVLFKTELSPASFRRIPENVLIKPWFPQTSILKHEKTILFVSHGGLNSINEAAYYGVPVLGIPFNGDQSYNIRLLEHLGMGYLLEQELIESPEILVTTLQQILRDRRYLESAKKRSAVFKDRPMPIVDEAVYWVEYVMKHKGTQHLRPAVIHLSWYEVLCLDAISSILGPLILLYNLYKFIKRKLAKKPEKEAPSGNKKKKKKQQ